LFSGITYAAFYKVATRVYKFSGQPIVKELINNKMGPAFDKRFRKHSKTMQHAAAGGLVGVGEVILLPLDTLKIIKQTNPVLAESPVSQLLYRHSMV